MVQRNKAMPQCSIERASLDASELDVLEKPIQGAILELLRWDRRVARVWRNNVGGLKWRRKRDGREKTVMFGFKGMSDICGFLRDGRFFAFEVKRSSGGVVSVHQQDFVDAVNHWNGVAGVVRSVDEVRAILDERCGPELEFASRVRPRTLK